MKAWVCFSDEADLWWLRVLKRGHRHCWVMLHDGLAWVFLDPLAGYTHVMTRHAEEPLDVVLDWVKKQGDVAIPVTLAEGDKLRPQCFVLFSCVEFVKRVVGIQKRAIVTPWQLRKHIEKHHKVVA